MITTGTITSGTGSVAVSGLHADLVTVAISGTYAGANLTFELSYDGTNYLPAACRQVGTQVAEAVTGALPSNLVRAWRCWSKDATHFRVRATALTSGTVAVSIIQSLGALQDMAEQQPSLCYVTKSATISNAAKAITHGDFAWGTTDLALARLAIISPRSAGVMFTYDGTDPTATFGHPIATSGIVAIEGNANIRALKFIREAGVDATLTITLEKP